MSRILLIGSGPMPDKTIKLMGFPQLRMWSILKRLRSQGHEVIPLLVGKTEGKELSIDPERLDAPATVRDLSRKFDCCVSAGPFLPALVSTWVHPEIPLWLDWPSDPHADFHARINAPGSEQDLSSAAAVQEIANIALCRADAIGVISERQRWATMGQLLMLGRSEPLLNEIIHTIPIAFDFPNPGLVSNASKRKAKFSLCGGANTWLADEEICAGLDKALSSDDSFEICWMGGPIPNHYTAGWKRIEQWARKHPKRVNLLEWPEHGKMIEQLSDSVGGIWLDRKGVEPLLGSRTRALLFSWMGLEIIGSPSTELGTRLDEQGLLHSCSNGEELKLSILEILKDRGLKAQQTQSWFNSQFAPKAVYAPLINWVNRPKKCPGISNASTALAREQRRARQELNAIHSSKTWRLANSAHKLLRSLTGGNEQN